MKSNENWATSVSLNEYSDLKRSKCGKNVFHFNHQSQLKSFEVFWKYHSEVKNTLNIRTYSMSEKKSLMQNLCTPRVSSGVIITDLNSAFFTSLNKKPSDTCVYQLHPQDYFLIHYYSLHPHWICFHRNTTANQADSHPQILMPAFNPQSTATPTATNRRTDR